MVRFESYRHFPFAQVTPMAVSAAQKTRQLLGFGAFRVDPEKELLLRDDEAVPLAPKAFQVLLVLMRHSKQLVTKDDLLKMVWPDTFVEEANLSRNIFLLRKALGENPQDHQYIVTVPGRGYRFAENVQLVPEREVSIVVAQHSKVQLEVKETRPWNWKWVALAGAFPVVAAAVFAIVSPRSLHLGRHPPVSLNTSDSVLVADFTNLTGDPVFDHALRQGLEVQLAQSPYLSLVSRYRIQQTLRLMGRPPDTQITGDVARDVCARIGSAAVLETSIQNVGTRYVLSLNATNCRTGDVIDQEQAQVARKEDVLGAIGRMATAFRERVGESAATLLEHDVPLAQATTSSLDALKAYSLGLEAEDSKSGQDPIPFFKRATELDPKRLLERRQKQAQFRDNDKRLDNFDFQFNPKMNRALVFDLATAAWVGKREDSLFLGPPGSGKSHIAQAIGHAVIQQGYRVLYREAHVLLEELADATLDGKRKEHIELLSTVSLLIIDDLGMRKLPVTAAEELLEIIMRRYERASTLLTSNRPVEDWGKLLGDSAAVTAMLDRLLHHGHVLKCGPRSWHTKTGAAGETQ